MRSRATRRQIRFYLGDALKIVERADPTLTVLDWLRLEQRLVGTKEGCAEGDCGACTVLVGHVFEGSVRYRAVNACIRFLATLDGCHVVTIEHLKAANGALHPIQQAMVDMHGSQCGFCTPGIVMSLYALWLNREEAGRKAVDGERIDIALQGNLCRCTGYAPIVQAGERAFADARKANDPLIANAAQMARRLSDLRDDATIELTTGAGRFIAPASVEDLADILASEPRATLVAGATDVGLWITKFMRTLDPVVYPGRIEALRAIEERDDAIRIGALASYSDVWPVLARHFPTMGELIRRIGGEQIRNMGTIGGNIANGSPIGDMPPPFIALGAEATLAGAGGRRSIPLEDFFIDYGRQDLRPGEFVESVRIPKLADGALFAVYKISKRFDEDISSACGAFHLTLGDDGLIAGARIAFGGMAATPKRAAGAEAALTGRAWTGAAVEDAVGALGRDYRPIGDMRASADYRRRVAGNLLRRFHLETTTPEVPTRARRGWEAAYG